jgi:hypothetical protein
MSAIAHGSTLGVTYWLAAHRAVVAGEVADMRTFDLGQSFDLVLVPREALQLLPPNEGAQALARLADHTAPGGLLFLDLATFLGGHDSRQIPTTTIRRSKTAYGSKTGRES